MINLFDFPVFGEGFAGGADETFDGEAAVVGHVAEVAAEGDVRLTIGSLAVQALVAPFPDEAAEQARVRIKFIPIFGEVAEGIAHGVGVFGGEDGAVVVGALGQGEELVPALVPGIVGLGVRGGGEARIETADDVHGGRILHFALRAFVMDGAGGIEFVPPAGDGGEIRAVAGFVGHGPDDHGGMILIALGQADGAVEEGALPARVIGEGTACAVGADIGLVEHVDAIAVAEVVPARIIGIMAGANGVDIGALHQGDVLKHAAEGEGVTGVRINLVPVHAAQANGLAIDEEAAVADFDLAEAHGAAIGFHDVAVVVAQGQDERVEIGGFSGPRGGLMDVAGEPGEFGFAALAHAFVENFGAVIGVQDFGGVMGEFAGEYWLIGGVE